MKFISDITVREIQYVGNDAMVVAAAKVSTNGEDAWKFALEDQKESNFGLINYLVAQKHGSPFEHNQITWFTHAPIFVYRELHRHRIASYNEESGRYKQLEPVFWIPKPERKMVPVEGYKPSRPQFESAKTDLHAKICQKIKTCAHIAYEDYDQMIKAGVAKEVARAVLPVNTYSSCWVTMNARALMHFLSLRTHREKFNPETKDGALFPSYPQAEIEELANQMEKTFANRFPLTHRAFCENGRVAP